MGNEWESLLDKTARHTKNLIPNTDSWINRTHGQLDYHLTGHEYFNDFLYKIKKIDNPICDLCTLNEPDTQNILSDCVLDSMTSEHSQFLTQATY